MIVALTGATGFLGGHVLSHLIEAGHEVSALTRRSQPDRDGVTWIAGALDDEVALIDLCSGANAVIHVAGVVNAPDAAAFDAGNRIGTFAMLHAAETAGVARFVHVSSLAAREPGLSVYGASKRAAEDAVITSTLDWQVVRPPAIYGPGDMEMLDMFRMAKQGLIALPPDGRLSVIHAEDMARLIVALAETSSGHSILEADDGKPGGWTHKEFAAAIGMAVGRNGVSVALPKAMLKFGSAIDRLVRGKGAKLTADRVNYFCHPDWVADPALRPPTELWMPEIDTHAGLVATAGWYRAEGLLSPKSK